MLVWKKKYFEQNKTCKSGFVPSLTKKKKSKMHFTLELNEAQKSIGKSKRKDLNREQRAKRERIENRE